MTRGDLLNVFEHEGGMSTRLQATFVSQECEYFKVDVIFRAVGNPELAGKELVNDVGDRRDLITSISRPYVAYAVMD